MKMQCEIIRDLIPLLEDDVCSAQSKEAVLDHIAECEECRRLYEAAQIHPEFILNAEEKAAKQAIDKGFRKVKRRWLASTLAVLIIIPVLYLSWGQYNGRGISFTNINELATARAFLNDLEQEDYEAAFRHYDLESLKERWLIDYFTEEKLENMEEDALRVFCESASLLKNTGGISNVKFLAIDKQADCYTIYYTIVVNGKEEELTVDVSDRGVIGFGGNGSFIDDPIAHFGSWSEYLWQEYEGCYFDPETHQYIYTE